MLQIYQDFHAGVERPAWPGALHWKLSSWPSLSSNDVDAHLYVNALHLGQKIQLKIVKIIQKFLTQFDPKILTFMLLSTLDPKFGKKIFSLFFKFTIRADHGKCSIGNWLISILMKKDEHVNALTRPQVGLEGKNGAGYNKWGGVCLMTQNYRLIINIIVSYQLS